MTRRIASLHNASLVANKDESGWLVISFELPPRGSSIQCSVAERRGIDRRIVEKRLAARDMAITTIEAGRPQFRANTPDLLEAIGLVTEVFSDLYEVETPEFWYYTPDAPKMEFCVRGYEPDDPRELTLTCCTWRDKLENTGTLRGFEEILRGSGLCDPESVKRRERVYELLLTEVAIKRPLDTFQELVNLHLEYLQHVPSAPREP